MLLVSLPNAANDHRTAILLNSYTASSGGGTRHSEMSLYHRGSEPRSSVSQLTTKRPPYPRNRKSELPASRHVCRSHKNIHVASPPPYQPDDESRVQPCRSGSKLTTSIAA